MRTSGNIIVDVHDRMEEMRSRVVTVECHECEGTGRTKATLMDLQDRSFSIMGEQGAAKKYFAIKKKLRQNGVTCCRCKGNGRIVID